MSYSSSGEGHSKSRSRFGTAPERECASATLRFTSGLRPAGGTFRGRKFTKNLRKTCVFCHPSKAMWLFSRSTFQQRRHAEDAGVHEGANARPFISSWGRRGAPAQVHGSGFAQMQSLCRAGTLARIDEPPNWRKAAPHTPCFLWQREPCLLASSLS